MKKFHSFLMGVAIGAGLALLFAPESGKKTRKKIKDFSEKVVDDVENFGEKAKDLYEGTAKEVKKSLR